MTRARVPGRASTRSSSSSTRSSRCRSPTSARFLAVDGVPSAHDLVWITVAMVGARSLAMGLNRLIDAGLDARNPRTAGRELPVGPALAGRGGRLLRGLARGLPDRRLPARPARALALADPGRRLRDLPVPEALDLALPPLARRGRRARAGRRLGGDHRHDPVGGVGARRRGRALGGRLRLLLRAARPRGRPRAGPAVGRDALRRARRLLGRAALPRRHGRVPRRGGARASTSASSTGWAWPSSPALLAYEHSLVRPGDLRRLDTRVLHDERRDLASRSSSSCCWTSCDPRARAREGLRREARPARARLRARARRLPGRHRRERLGQDDAAAALRRARRSRPAARSRSSRSAARSASSATSRSSTAS